ncbi:PD-(D/E)XK nuclease-like domain-containing protein [Paenibacillus sp. HWE-109]|uniref:PD-(D/E)XK nuclease-like domain-containing protein n=1 Tax=Paenibacillus sp. HWE-109 TaxID=1306526 RepID=UPI001EDCB82D|nr:PD-(D/E)XK nuclease-like domain-containing protein [Paenibacillus sp. HWE-109]UKS25050.1 PD-(D/E)XK nuclease-like domain-containing protein [Paenibacillus sp. HWE-109]
MLILTSQNYHSDEANKQYMSNSQYKDFLACESKAMAKINGWKESAPSVFGVGSYVHAAFEGTLDTYKIEYATEIFNAKGKPYADYAKADDMIRVLKSDPFCMFILQGQKEVIMTAGFAGAVWKIRLDLYAPERSLFADIKTVKSIHDKYWDNDRGYVSFVEAYKYDTQMAIYAEIEKRFSKRQNWYKPLIVAVSKEDVPDKEVIGFDDNDIERELETIAGNMPRIMSVKTGMEEPNRCEKCRFCRESKQLKGITHYLDLQVG